MVPAVRSGGGCTVLRRPCDGRSLASAGWLGHEGSGASRLTSADEADDVGVKVGKEERVCARRSKGAGQDVLWKEAEVCAVELDCVANCGGDVLEVKSTIDDAGR